MLGYVRIGSVKLGELFLLDLVSNDSVPEAVSRQFTNGHSVALHGLQCGSAAVGEFGHLEAF